MSDRPSRNRAARLRNFVTHGLAAGFGVLMGVALWVHLPSPTASAVKREAHPAPVQKYSSKISNITLAPTPNPLGPKYRQQYDFKADWFTHNVPIWRTALAPFAGKPGLRYLEVGIYEGRSCLWMLENILTAEDARVTGVDIFDGPIRKRFEDNLAKSGANSKVDLIIGASQVELRKLPIQSFDIIYIDGSHAPPDVLEDAVLASRLIKPGGVLIFDDYEWPRVPVEEGPKLAIDMFYQLYGNQFTTLHKGYQVLLQKE